MEASIFKQLLELGLFFLKLFFANQNQGDYGNTIETSKGIAWHMVAIDPADKYYN